MAITKASTKLKKGAQAAAIIEAAGSKSTAKPKEATKGKKSAAAKRKTAIVVAVANKTQESDFEDSDEDEMPGIPAVRSKTAALQKQIDDLKAEKDQLKDTLEDKKQELEMLQLQNNLLNEDLNDVKDELNTAKITQIIACPEILNLYAQNPAGHSYAEVKHLAHYKLYKKMQIDKFNKEIEAYDKKLKDAADNNLPAPPLTKPTKPKLTTQTKCRHCITGTEKKSKNSTTYFCVQCLLRHNLGKLTAVCIECQHAGRHEADPFCFLVEE